MQNHIDRLIQEAFSYIQNGNFDASEGLLKNVIQLKPNDFNANNLLGVIYIEKNMPDACISHLKKALKIEPNNASTNYNMANALMLKEQHSQALPFHTKATQFNPNDYWANTNYGISLFKLNQLGKAQSLFQKAVDLNPEIPGGWLNLANCLKALGQSSEALSHYERALTLDPQYIEAWFNAGVVLFELKRHEDALAAYNQAIALNPEYHEAWSNAGTNLEKLKRYDAALNCFDKALSLSPEALGDLVNKANILRSLKRYEEALEYCNLALEKTPESPEYLSNKGLLLFDLKHYDETIPVYQKALQLNPHIPYLLSYLIHTKMLVNNWWQLESEIDILIKKINRKNSILCILGDIFENKCSIHSNDIELFFYLINKIEEFRVYTMIIPGNHDMNINNIEKIDNISILLNDKYNKYIKCFGKTQVFTFKTKDGKLYVSQRGFYNPKTNLHIPTTTTSFKIPVTTEYQKYWDMAVNDYIQSKNIYDPSWSLENINDQIKKIEDEIKITNNTDIVKVGKVFISVIKSVEENINKWLIDPDKQIAKNNLNQLKGLAKEKGLSV
jgi:tetratricopeptide (TPR) repeat protein